MQLAFRDGSHIVTPMHWSAARRRLGGGVGALDQTSQTIAGIAATTATTTTGILAALGTFGAMGGPVTAAVAGIVAIGVALANLFSGCGQTCVEATSLANQAGALIDQAFYAYMNSPIHYASMQAAYLNLFDGTWNAMVKACSNPALGAAGQRCISDRQQGSCAYKTSPGGWQQTSTGWTYVDYGANGSGTTCWNSFIGRRDPVANDPTVVPDPVGAITDPTTGAVTGVTTGASDSTLFAGMGPVLLIGGGIAAALLLLGND